MTDSDFPGVWSYYDVVEHEADGNLSVNTMKIKVSPYSNFNMEIQDSDRSDPNLDYTYYDDEKNFANEKYWDTLDAHLKEFACPRHKYKEGAQTLKNESNIISFPRDMDKHGVFYLVPNSCKIKNNKLYGFHYNPERHIAKLALDEQFSRMMLRNLINTGKLKNIDKVISVGNQSILLHANCNTLYPNLELPSECVIKLFKTKIIELIAEKPFVKPDFRYTQLFKKNTRHVVRQWAQDEFNILTEMEKIGVNCPKPIFIKSHYIIMSYIGDKDPAPTLATLKLEQEKWEHIYSKVLQVIVKLYEGGFVHGDLSEYNILWWDNKCWVIDVSQTLSKDHPKALEYLWRDCKTISRFFEKRLPHKIKSPQKLFTKLSSQYR